jgi:hypothetical protein
MTDPLCVADSMTTVFSCAGNEQPAVCCPLVATHPTPDSVPPMHPPCGRLSVCVSMEGSTASEGSEALTASHADGSVALADSQACGSETPTKSDTDEPVSSGTVVFSTDSLERQELEAESQAFLLEEHVATVSVDALCKGKKLGRGATGEVWEVTDEGHPGAVFAFKEIKAREAPKHRAIFVQECNVHSTLSHPNVLRFDRAVMGRRRSDGAEAVVGHLTEVAQGGSLTQYMKDKDLTFHEKIRLALDVIDGVEYLHEKGLVHFDLKPDNITIHTEGGLPEAKLADLGLLLGGFGRGKAQRLRFRGTVTYAAPELFIAAKDVTPAADIWSLGCILVDLAAGERHTHFHRLEDDDAYIAAHRSGTWRPHVPQTEPELERVILACLAHDAQKRPSLSAIRKELQSILDNGPGQGVGVGQGGAAALWGQAEE